MTTKVATVTPDAPLGHVLELMTDRGVTGLPVVDAARRVVGVVTEADLVAKEAYPRSKRPQLSALGDLLWDRRNLWWQKAAGLTAGEVMTSPAHTILGDTELECAAARMLTLGVKRLPVVDHDGRLIGIISRRDLLRLFRTAEALSHDLAHSESDWYAGVPSS